MSGHTTDTICAIATPVGEGGIGIIRISGGQALEVASGVVGLRSGKPLEGVPNHRLHVGKVHAGSDATVMDEALVAVMRGPKSYTGEDVVEIHCHGGRLILSLVCEALVAHGARLAEPGEFTRRAFLNGRLDLVQAEAVLDTIRANTAASLRVAQEQLQGRLSQKIHELREELVRLLAQIEAEMDFAEEDLAFITKEDLASSLRRLSEEISELVSTAERGRVLREGITAAIIGKPNVGKSSLLNALLQTDRAIVSPIPGTTRDVIEEGVNIEGISLRLLDTAGLRSTSEIVEAEGIRRTKSVVDQAELLMIVVDGSEPLSHEDVDIIRNNYGSKRLVVVNKCDLGCRWEQGYLEKTVDACSKKGQGGMNSAPIVFLSAKTGAGLDDLRKAVGAILAEPATEARDSVVITRLRHKVALIRAQEAIARGLEICQRPMAGECLAMELRLGLDALGEIIGAVSTEDILDRIFADFCIGK